jgi:hypothetical protein
MSLGIELMKQLNEGGLQVAPLDIVETVKDKVSEACTELLDIGARIRPLFVNGKQIGWIRGVHLTETRMFQRWITDSNELLTHVLLLATTLSKQEIEDLSTSEIHSLARLVRNMNDYDISLFPYMAAFSTTLTSEHLWYGKGMKLSSFENREISLPDGKIIRVVRPSDHTRLWATLCSYRDAAKRRLDESMSALTIIRPWTGKSSDALANELKNISKSLQPDNLDPWMNIVKTAKSDVNDGWAHADDTVEGLVQRELIGMINNDRHERLIAEFEKQQRAAAEKQKQEIEKILRTSSEKGVWEETIPVIVTEKEVRKTQQDLQKGKPKITPVDDSESQTEPRERIRRYDQ